MWDSLRGQWTTDAGNRTCASGAPCQQQTETPLQGCIGFLDVLRQPIRERRMTRGKLFIFKSVFNKMFFLFISVMMPLILVGILIYYWGDASIKREIMNNTRSNVAFVKNHVEMEVNRVRLLQYDSLVDETIARTINEYGIVKNYDLYMNIRELQQRLSIMKNSSNIIEDVILYIPAMEKKISAQHGVSNDLFHADILHKLDEYEAAGNAPLRFQEEGIFSSFVVPVHYKNRQALPNFLLEVVISKPGLTNVMSKFEYYQGITILFDTHQIKLTAGAQLERERLLKEALELDALVQDAYFNTILLDGKRYIVSAEWSDYLEAGVAGIIPVDDIYSASERYKLIIWGYMLVALMVIAVFSRYMRKLVHDPIKMILSAFKNMEQGELSTRIHSKGEKEFDYLFQGFNHMMERLDVLIRKISEQEVLTKNAEIKQLQSQINPHFLYNCFFILHRSIKLHDEDVSLEMSKYLGKHFEYITRNAVLKTNLKDEIEYAQNYCNIQLMRFEKTLSILFDDLDEAFYDIKVPKLILQPILENAIEHGMKNSLGKGMIHVHFEKEGEYLKLIVEDSGMSLTDEALLLLQDKLAGNDANVETTGIINVHKRLALEYGDACGVRVSRSSLGGLQVVITLRLGKELAYVPAIDNR